MAEKGGRALHRNDDRPDYAGECRPNESGAWSAALYERDRDDRADQQKRHQRLRIARKIPIDIHGVLPSKPETRADSGAAPVARRVVLCLFLLPSVVLDAPTPGKV